jgi:hypothetical protein
MASSGCIPRGCETLSLLLDSELYTACCLLALGPDGELMLPVLRPFDLRFNLVPNQRTTVFSGDLRLSIGSATRRVERCQTMARRPVSARPSVSSSANSKSPPIGSPDAIRVTAKPGMSRSTRTR